MRKFTAMFLLLCLCTISFFGCLSTQHYEGATAGAIIGGVSGALLDKRNHWRGGAIGAGLGAILGATIVDVASKGSREAYDSGKRVEYRTEDNRGYYVAEPITDYYYKDPNTKCRKVSEKIYENGKIVKDTVKEICESTKTERYY